MKADPKFASAWYNLADLLDDQGRARKRSNALSRALDADPAYVDAMFNMGLLLQRLERHAEAAAMWRRYLALDDNSPWAARARRALKYCEMQLMLFLSSRPSDRGRTRKIPAAPKRSLEECARGVREQARLLPHAEPKAESKAESARCLRRAETRCAPAALRSAARARRRAEELGDHARARASRSARSGLPSAPKIIRSNISISRATFPRANMAAAR